MSDAQDVVVTVEDARAALQKSPVYAPGLSSSERANLLDVLQEIDSHQGQELAVVVAPHLFVDGRQVAEQILAEVPYSAVLVRTPLGYDVASNVDTRATADAVTMVLNTELPEAATGADQYASLSSEFVVSPAAVGLGGVAFIAVVLALAVVKEFGLTKR